MKTIIYDFADGKREIEVSDETAELYESILKYEKKVNRKETRRHVSLNAMMDAGFDFADPSSDIETTLEREAAYAEEERKDAIEAEEEELYLEQEQLWLESKLTPRQAKAYFMFIYLEMKKVEIAEEMNVTEGAVRKLILKAEENLAKLRRKEMQEKSGKKPLGKKETAELNLRLLNALFGK